MPNKDKHIKQYKCNLSLFNLKTFNINDTKYSDWFMTVAFYAAVHLIESELAEIPFDSRTHEDRENAMLKLNTLKDVVSQYTALRNQSRLARYKCKRFPKKDLADAFKHLKTIEKVVLSS